MEEDKIVLKYYYVHVSSGVIEKHIDVETGEILYNTTYEGNEGDEYKTEPKEFEHYELVEEKYPENAEGTMTIEAITVNYYYKKKIEEPVEPIEPTEPEIPGEGGDDPSTDNPIIDEEQKQPQVKDPTAVDKVIPSAGLTKEQIAIIVVVVMSVIAGVLVVIAIKGTILSKKYKK